ncbi:putative polypeptide N-acetylgalactosaminyltransferase 10 isoform X2 [Tubulanus polymorphus]|uniref:putative polypeptide N-acetylgalactosaminyltransferase 10 isoform X2 n=1 Tax=Tubulanus polymorphus TaxID=672921 RepID=UPI003DA54151
MRRNSVRLLKYVCVVGLFLLVAPAVLKYYSMSGDESADSEKAQRFEHGLRNNAGLVMNLENSRETAKKPPDAEESNRIQVTAPPGAIIGSDSNLPLKKIDWHDYGAISNELKRKGPGEQGMGVHLDASDNDKKNELYKVNGFNALASDKISLNRALRDIRNPACRTQKYWSKLPNASIVIPFHNEHWSTLLRTVVSCRTRAPRHLLHEIILVDDFSTKEHCKKPLDDYVANNFDNVKVVRAQKREGLIRTRLLGAKAATGQVLIFLDSHCECNVNWLPPLLDPIAEDRKTVVCPFIDVLDYETFMYRAQDEGARGAFDWEFFYKRLPLLPEDRANPAKPFKSPVMAGGLFAMDKSWFWDLGGYDPGLEIWGGEQYELSFKIWQCGGTMVDTACSRIAHVYRKFAPFPNPGLGDFVGKNYKRVAEVWMDEYKEHLYRRRPHYRQLNAGDLTAQIAIRNRLKCKSFKWFMTEIAFDLPKHYPPVEPPSYASGELRNLGNNMCVDTRFKSANERFGLEECVADGHGRSGEQQFELTWHKDIRPNKRNVCFDVSQSIHKAPVILFACHGMKGNQFWKYNVDTKQVYHVSSSRCLDSNGDTKEIYIANCDANSKTQRWSFKTVNETELRRLWSS